MYFRGINIKDMKVFPKYLFSLLLLFFSVSAVSQQVAGAMTEKPQRWVFGGDFGMGFSNYGSNILISPQIGYRITPKWEAGTRLTYNYSSYKKRKQ